MYYNTTIKFYDSEIRPSLRYVIYSSLRKILTDDEALALAANHKVREATDQAEGLEALKAKSLRDYKQEALSRACRRIKHILRLNYSNRLKLLTLTYRDVVTDRGKVLNDIKNMCKRYKLLEGKDLKYIATLELQKERGCLHAHLIVDSRYIPTERWYLYFWQQGFVKINTISRGKSKSDLLNAINYTLKYIKKDFETADEYDHVYFRSRNWRIDQKKEYDVSKSRLDCLLHATTYFNSGDYITDSFEFEIYNGDIVTVLDIYTNT